jgi:hypothetical protein
MAMAAPHAGSGKPFTAASAALSTEKLDSKFKGRLPITELTEDQAILHALNRLAYGASSGDLERVRKMGLEKWIDQQLHPESIDDSALDTRLQRYPTINASASRLLNEYPPPGLAAKKEGET